MGNKCDCVNDNTYDDDEDDIDENILREFWSKIFVKSPDNLNFVAFKGKFLFFKIKNIALLFRMSCVSGTYFIEILNAKAVISSTHFDDDIDMINYILEFV
ncbi:MAG: hypothetical protein Edafosvirus5_33 [Edafosvirus sp.]|uniref:Uncharacterized protein n=1 Tax=Edafosvirus sp. TaxID=2487765 RepID=A0A3G4ZTA3_9VIRU|nr:MAG: hypothetical protein Edafosvirus5_33 [Edafosvirus sp.]